jgi:hypothetical protein
MVKLPLPDVYLKFLTIKERSLPSSLLQYRLVNISVPNITTQKTVIFIVTAVRTLNWTNYKDKFSLVIVLREGREGGLITQNLLPSSAETFRVEACKGHPDTSVLQRIILYMLLMQGIIFRGARGSVVGWGIPDEVIGFFNWLNPSSRTMTLGSTQPLTEMNTRNLPGGKGRPALEVDNLAAICEPTV